MPAVDFSVVPGYKRYSCAELVEVAWGSINNQQHTEYAILAEVWRTGGVFLVDDPALPGATIRISLPEAEIDGVVRACRRERDSWAIEVRVEATEEWFGGRYRPDVLSRGEATGMPLFGMARPHQIQPRAW